MLSFVNLPRIRRLIRREFAPFDRKICYKMFSPSLLRVIRRFSMSSLGRRSFSTWMISYNFWSNSSEATTFLRSAWYLGWPKKPSRVT